MDVIDVGTPKRRYFLYTTYCTWVGDVAVKQCVWCLNPLRLLICKTLSQGFLGCSALVTQTINKSLTGKHEMHRHMVWLARLQSGSSWEMRFGQRVLFTLIIYCPLCPLLSVSLSVFSHCCSCHVMSCCMSDWKHRRAWCIATYWRICQTSCLKFPKRLHNSHVPLVYLAPNHSVVVWFGHISYNKDVIGVSQATDHCLAFLLLIVLSSCISLVFSLIDESDFPFWNTDSH